MKLIRDIILIISVFGLFAYSPKLLQISSGVIQSQNVESVVVDDALVFWGHQGNYGINSAQTNIILGVLSLSTDADWTQIACGDNHCLAIKGGQLYSWGFDQFGRTGLGKGITSTPTFATYTTTPTLVDSRADWTDVSAGSSHSGAIRAGRLYTWGAGSLGQLGHGSTTSYDTITQVGTDTDWTDISCGHDWSAAVKGGQLLTCGTNNSFRTGLNISTGTTTSFTVADATATWVSVYCGNTHGIGIRTDSLFSWGPNTNGRTGQGTTSGSTQIPTQVGTLTGWTSGSSGNTHTAAIRNDSLYTFGLQLYGRLGNGEVANGNISNPTLIDGIGWSDVEANRGSIAGANMEFTYAIRNDSLFATGLNAKGQLGIDLTTTETGTFSLVDSTNFNYIKVAAGSGFGIAIRGN